MPDTKQRPYRPLQSTFSGDSRDEIRLLKLAPGSYDDSIVTTLTTVNVDHRPHYEALSYVWGRELCETPASVNKCALQITKNLDVALRHLRFETTERIIWIDALCIDQLNIEERNRQVQLMSHIYRYASEVRIWLGPGDAASDFVMDRVARGYQLSVKDDDAPYFVYYVLQLMKREWFERVWVIQEVALASIAVVQCGKLFANLSSLSDSLLSVYGYSGEFSTYYFNSRAEITKGNAPAPVWNHHAAWVAFLRDVNPYNSPIADLNELSQPAGPSPTMPHPFENLLYEYGHTFGNLRLVFNREVSKGVQQPFYKACRDTSYCKATDARDKIFGILAMCHFQEREDGEFLPGTHRIIPDYSKAAATVFSEAMAVIIQQGFEFGYPMILLRHPGHTNVPTNLPSWVPDFTYPPFHFEMEPRRLTVVRTPQQFDPKPLCRPAGNFSSMVYGIDSREHFAASFSRDFRSLYTKGTLLGRVSACTFLDPAKAIPDESPDALAKLRFEFVRQIQDFIAAANEPRDTILRAMLGNSQSISLVDRVLGDGLLGPVFQTQESDISPLRLETGKHQDLWTLLSETALNRTVYVTDTGHAGLAMGDAREGDVLVGLFGIMFPFILRRGDDGTYSMVSVAHVVDHELGVGTSPEEDFTIV